MVETSFTLGKSEYIAAETLAINHRQKSLTALGNLLFLTLLVGSAAIFYISGGIAASFTVSILICLIWVVIFFVFRPLLQIGFFAVRFRTEASRFQNVHLILDDEGYHRIYTEFGDRPTEWREFTGWLEGRTEFVLLTDNQIHPIPKRALDDAAQIDLRGLLNRHINPVGRMRKRR